MPKHLHSWILNIFLLINTYSIFTASLPDHLQRHNPLLKTTQRNIEFLLIVIVSFSAKCWMFYIETHFILHGFGIHSTFCHLFYCCWRGAGCSAPVGNFAKAERRYATDFVAINILPAAETVTSATCFLEETRKFWRLTSPNSHFQMYPD